MEDLISQMENFLTDMYDHRRETEHRSQMFHLCMVETKTEGMPRRNLKRKQALEMEEPVWGNLPSSLVMPILRLLPAKSQARFQCVDKEWGDIISGKKFRYESGLATATTRGPTPWLVVERPWTDDGQTQEYDTALHRFKTLEMGIPRAARPDDLRHFRWEDGLLLVATARVPAGVNLAPWVDLRINLVNPVTRTWSRVSPMPKGWPTGFGSAVRVTAVLTPDGTRLERVLVRQGEGDCLTSTGPVMSRLHRYSVETRVWETGPLLRCDCCQQGTLALLPGSAGTGQSHPCLARTFYNRNYYMKGNLYVLANGDNVDVVVLSGQDGSFIRTIPGTRLPWFAVRLGPEYDPLDNPKKYYLRHLVVHRECLFMVEGTNTYCAIRKLVAGPAVEEQWEDVCIRNWPSLPRARRWVLHDAVARGSCIYVSGHHWNGVTVVLSYNIFTQKWNIMGQLNPKYDKLMKWKDPLLLFKTSGFAARSGPLFVPRSNLYLDLAIGEAEQYGF